MATVNFIPDMTSNTTPSGVASASSSELPAYNAMDRDTSTYWRSGDFNSSWIQYEFTSSRTCTSYSITPKFSSSLGDSPNVRLKASNSGLFSGEEVVLDSQLSLSYSTSKITFSFSNTTAYKYYRIYIEQTIYSTWGVSLAEMELLGEVVAISSISVSVTSHAEHTTNSASASASVTASVEHKTNSASISASVMAYAKNKALNKATPTASATVSSDGSRKAFGYGFEIVGELQLASIVQTFRFVEEIEQAPAPKMIQRVNV
jgi:hypothetical protein